MCFPEKWIARRGRCAVPEIFFRIRRCRRSWAALRLYMARLLNSLAFLAANLLPGVAHAFAFVRFRRIGAANFRRDLPDQFFVDPLNGDLCPIGHRDFDLLRNRKQNWVRKAQTEIEVCTLDGGFEPDAFDLEIFCES